MSDLKHARLMLRMAQRDLKALQGMTDREVFEDEVFGFHAQQAVEKALKSWLSLARIEYPRTHDLEELLAILDERGETVPGKFSPLMSLTDFAVQFRYELAAEVNTLSSGGSAASRFTTLRRPSCRHER